MRKLLVTSLSAVLIFFGLPILKADAAIVKTTITITTPSFVFAGVANPIDVAVCPKESLSATTCVMGGPERKVTLWANGIKVQTLDTIGGGGMAAFSWTPQRSGSLNLKVSVAARPGYKALNSEIKKVNVKPRTAPSSLGTTSCGTVCVSGIPNTLDLNKEIVLTAGLASGASKGRKIRFQTLRITNKYEDQFSGISTWQEDANRYGVSLSFSEIDSFSDCSPGETLTWNFRFYADASSKSPAAATKAKWIDVICPNTGGNEGEIQMSVDYSNQDINYDDSYPPDIEVFITAPSDAQYSIWSEYCSTDNDCSDELNWSAMDGYSKSDNIFGSRNFSLKADPGDYGNYWVRITVIPWTDQAMFESDWFSVDLW